jgi:hypothetical protein
MQNGEGIYDLEDERRERKNGDNLQGAIALPTRHLLKERLICRPPATANGIGTDGITTEHCEWCIRLTFSLIRN